MSVRGRYNSSPSVHFITFCLLTNSLNCSSFSIPLPPSVTIDSLYKVTEGRQSDIFHRHAEGSFDPACCFTVYHGNHMESLDLVTSNAEEARTWVTGLRYLMAGISDEDSLAKRQRTHDQYPLIYIALYIHININMISNLHLPREGERFRPCSDCQPRPVFGHIKNVSRLILESPYSQNLHEMLFLQIGFEPHLEVV